MTTSSVMGRPRKHPTLSDINPETLRISASARASSYASEATATALRAGSSIDALWCFVRSGEPPTHRSLRRTNAIVIISNFFSFTVLTCFVYLWLQVSTPKPFPPYHPSNQDRQDLEVRLAPKKEKRTLTQHIRNVMRRKLSFD
jgi:hypothetical protein